MILPHLVQGSPAWAEWRHEGIGGSDAPIILGVSGDLEKLLVEKLTPPVFNGQYPAHFRPKGPSDAVLEFQRRTGYLVQPGCVRNDDEPWITATLDGITFLADGIVKCGPRKVLDHEVALHGMVPDAWVPQVQHCLLASGADVCWWISWTDAKRFATGQRHAIVEVYPDAEYMAALLTAEAEFYRRVQLAQSGGKWGQHDDGNTAGAHGGAVGGPQATAG